MELREDGIIIANRMDCILAVAGQEKGQKDWFGLTSTQDQIAVTPDQALQITQQGLIALGKHLDKYSELPEELIAEYEPYMDNIFNAVQSCLLVRKQLRKQEAQSQAS